MSDDLAARRARHRPHQEAREAVPGFRPIPVACCAFCHQPWKCDAAVLGDEVERLWRHLETEQAAWVPVHRAELEHERQARQAAEAQVQEEFQANTGIREAQTRLAGAFQREHARAERYWEALERLEEMTNDPSSHPEDIIMDIRKEARQALADDGHAG